jgi:hypothetical protein
MVGQFTSNCSSLHSEGFINVQVFGDFKEMVLLFCVTSYVIINFISPTSESVSSSMSFIKSIKRKLTVLQTLNLIVNVRRISFYFGVGR